MKRINLFILFFVLSSLMLGLSSCSTSTDEERMGYPAYKPIPPANYKERIPQHIATTEKVVVVDPRVHVWGAYGSDGNLIRAGLASAGSDWCSDLGRPCHTTVGSFRIFSLGSPNCKSSRFPIPRGGAPMPYCMYFHNSEALHGSPEGEVVEGNVSHGCVRVHVQDAEWIRYNFASNGTKIIVKPY